MDLELKYYNQQEVWDRYSENTHDIMRAKEIVSYLPDEVKSVLDIGCGNGIITNLIDRELVLGVDFASVPLKNVERNAICASIDRLPFKKNKFDLILMTEVLEHLSDQIYIKAIQEINRLKAKYLLISIPFEENLEANQCKCGLCGFVFNTSHHYRKFDEHWYTKEFPDYDIQLVRYTTNNPPLNLHIVQLKHYCGVYSGYKNTSCPRCGGPPISSRIILRYVLGGLSLLDITIKRLLRIRKPYHQIVLLIRNDKSSLMS